MKLLIALLLATVTTLAQHPLDTIRVQRLVVDTSANSLVPYPRPARLLHLLEVRELHNDRGNTSWAFDCINCLSLDYHKHLRYLTLLKSPIPFGWVVFENTILPEADPVPPPHEWPLEPGTIMFGDTVRMLPTGAFGDAIWRKWTTSLSGDTIVTLSSRSRGNTGWAIDPGPQSQLPFTRSLEMPYLTSLNPWGDDPKDAYTWLPRRLRKRYLKYLKTHPNAQ